MSPNIKVWLFLLGDSVPISCFSTRVARALIFYALLALDLGANRVQLSRQPHCFHKQFMADTTAAEVTRTGIRLSLKAFYPTYHLR